VIAWCVWLLLCLIVVSPLIALGWCWRWLVVAGTGTSRGAWLIAFALFGVAGCGAQLTYHLGTGLILEPALIGVPAGITFGALSVPIAELALARAGLSQRTRSTLRLGCLLLTAASMFAALVLFRWSRGLDLAPYVHHRAGGGFLGAYTEVPAHVRVLLTLAFPATAAALIHLLREARDLKPRHVGRLIAAFGAFAPRSATWRCSVGRRPAVSPTSSAGRRSKRGR
jgi:hypothetical protein